MSTAAIVWAAVASILWRVPRCPRALEAAADELEVAELRALIRYDRTVRAELARCPIGGARADA